MDYTQSNIDCEKNKQFPSVICLFENGFENKVDDNTPKDMVLVFGLTNSYKHNFTKFIATKVESDNSFNYHIASNLSFPNLLTNSELNTAFYNYPAFDSDQSFEEKVSAKYLLKKIVDYADSIKLILTISETQIISNFKLLIENTVKIIKNIDKFKEGIALVVTKEDYLADEKENSESDKNFIENIADKLTNILQIYSTSTSRSETEQELIKILLKKESDAYTKIGVFKKSEFIRDKLSKNQLINKKSLEAVVHSNTKFVIHDKNDFIFIISTTHLTNAGGINNIKEAIQAGISKNINKIRREIVEYYENQEHQLIDVEEIYRKIGLGSHELRKLQKKNFSSTIHFLTEFINLKNIHIIVPPQIIISINNYIEYMNFIEALNLPLELQIIRKDLIKIDTESYRKNFLNIIKSIVKDLKKSKSWYEFLIDFHTALSTYNAQNNREAIIQHIIDLIQEKLTWTVNSNDHSYLDSNEYVTRKKKLIKSVDEIITKANISNSSQIHTSLEQANISHIKLNFLSKMLNSLFFSSDKMVATCSKGKLTIQGQFVRLTDVFKEENSKCDKTIPIRAIELFASNTIFIDGVFNKTGDAVHLSIVSPTLEIIGYPKIILDGKAGEAHHNTTAEAVANIPGSNGNDGKPGKPGNPSGNILIIGSSFVNDQNLTISAVGGKGGAGQNGSNGIIGKSSPDIAEHSDENPVSQFLYPEICQEQATDTLTRHFKCREKQDSCTDGGEGGRGGSGGIGGKGGNVQIVKLDGDSNINSIYGDGEKGSNGSHGSDQPGGVTKILIFDYSITPFTTGTGFYGKLYFKSEYANQKVTSEYCNPGISDKSSFNSENSEKPKLSEIRKPADILNDYKNYVRTICPLNERIRDQPLRKFLDRIENNEILKVPDDCMPLINEFRSLENQFFNLHKQTSFLPFYESLIERITKHSDWFYQNKKDLKKKHSKEESSKNPNLNGEELYSITEKWFNDRHYALKYLYTATLSKVISIRNDKSGNLILNIQEYLDTAIEKINQLKDYNKMVSLDSMQRNYRDSMNKKIEEALSLIPKVKEDINTLLKKVDDDIKQVIEEIKSLETKIENNKPKLKELEKKLQNAIMIRSVLAIPTMAAKILSLTTPLGQTAASAISGTTLLIESSTISKVDEKNIEVQSLPKVFDKYIPNIPELKDKKKIIQKQIRLAQKQLRMTENMPSPPKSIKEFKNNLNATYVYLQKDKKNKTMNIEEVKKIETAELYLIQNQTAVLKDFENHQRTGPWLNKTINAAQQLDLINVPLNIYDNIKKDKEKIDIIHRAIEKSDKQLKNLDMYKREIYERIIPLCKNLQNRLYKFGKDATMNKSHAALDINKWQMQRLLRNVKSEIQKMTKDFEVEEDIASLMGELDYALSAMINLYDLMEDYRDRKELADYVRNINFNGDVDAEMIADADLRSAINALKLSIHSNIILEEYERSVYAVKQKVYPLAHKFLEKYQLPTTRDNSSNIVSLANAAAAALTDIRDKIRKSSLESQLEDKYWFPDDSEFNVDDEHRNAFYTWKYNENKHAISRLLRGQQVTLKSDITQGSPFSAVKFRLIRMNFIFSNKTVEKEFKKELKHFDLIMIHLGNSQYKCHDKFHVIVNDEQYLKIEFATSKGNKVFAKLKDNEATLSPYALWNVSLVSLNKDFNSLAKYENMPIDLALEGTGSYLETHDEVATAKICNDDLAKYYKRDETISGIATTKLLKKVPFEIPEIEKSHADVLENYQRKRRSLNNYEFEKSASSGASSNMKSSLINNIFYLVETCFAAYQYLDPVPKIRQWFTNNNVNSDPDDYINSNNYATVDMQMYNSVFLDTQLPKGSNIYIDDKSSTNNDLLHDNLCCNSGNLLLLDLLIRSKNGVKHRNESFVTNTKIHLECAQQLAYRGHIE